MAGEICFHDNKPGNCPQIRGNSAPLFLHPGALPQRGPFFTPILPHVALMFNRFVVQNLARAGDGGPFTRLCCKMATGSGKTILR
jgi:hypothetical protein